MSIATVATLNTQQFFAIIHNWHCNKCHTENIIYLFANYETFLYKCFVILETKSTKLLQSDHLSIKFFYAANILNVMLLFQNARVASVVLQLRCLEGRRLTRLET